ncbi:MAG TPA: hypothetical protein VMU19_09340 [Bryobacteraceae bacterium]|nr:hypothetical protein [Bryobacteraceae bacterium]
MTTFHAALRIFRKDVRRLWPQCALACAAIAWSAAYNPMGGDHYAELRHLLAPVLCWVLAISVIHEERLVGDNQYWLTRPYTWRTLLAAKALFLLAFINLPLLVFQCVGIAAAGFSPLAWISALFWRQVFISIFFVMPAVALAALTKSIGQVILSAGASGLALLIVMGLLAELSGDWSIDWGDLEWIKQCGAALAAAGASAVIVFQYRRRRKALAAGMLAGVFALCMAVVFAPFWSAAPAIQRWFSREPALGEQVRLQVDESRIGKHPLNRLRGSFDQEGVRLEIPLSADVPPGTFLGGSRTSVRIEAPGRTPRSMLQVSRDFHRASDGAWLTVYVPPDVYQSIQFTPVRFSATVELVLFRPLAVLSDYDVNPTTKAANVAGLARCQFARIWPNCVSPSDRVAITAESGEEPLIGSAPPLSPIPMEMGFQGLARTFAASNDPVAAPGPLSISRPVAYVERSLEARDVRLADFRVETGGAAPGSR